jgi:hypothetical protein
MLIAYDNHNGRARTVLNSYLDETGLGDIDDFLFLIKRKFLLGVHSVFLDAILAALTKKHGTQQAIAEALGLKDRTSISQMIRSGSIDGLRITTAFYHCPNLIADLPSREQAALHGFARATSFIKARSLSDPSIEGSMTAQDVSLLVGVLASPDWEPALRNPDPCSVRQIAVQIVEERNPLPNHSLMKAKYRPEQYVLMLQDLSLKWSDFFVVALWAIPECIPGADTEIEAA